MTEVYKKIDSNTLRVTNTHVYQVERKHLEEEKQMAEQDKKRAQEQIDEINAKLAILNEV